MKVYVVVAHPNLPKSRVNARLLAALPSNPDLRVCDLYETYPTHFIDVDREQAQLAWCDVLVLQHPFYWYSCPSLLKEWIDAVLEVGFAYGPGGEALKGKGWQQAISAGGGAEAYARTGANRFSVAELLRPFEQTAGLCQMPMLEPIVVYGASRMAAPELDAAVAAYAARVSDLLEGRWPSVHSTFVGSL